MVNSSVIIIIVVVAVALYLIYSQNMHNKNIIHPDHIAHLKSNLMQQGHQATTHEGCPECEQYKKMISQLQQTGGPTKIVIDKNNDPYSDAIKRQDAYTMYDPLTYPQMRLPREILEKYNEYSQQFGTNPPFGQATQPLFDNPILNGLLIKQVDENEPFTDNIPNAVPLFRVKSAKNTNRFFYYIIDQRYLSKLQVKIPLDHIKVNGTRYNNADYYGLPELNDEDVIENISIFPNTKFRVTLYKTYHFP